MAPKATTHLDRMIGERLRLARQIRGVKLETLATRLGISLQQIQKYEDGTNRISAARLLQTAEILDLPVGWFCEQSPKNELRLGISPRLLAKIARLNPEQRARLEQVVDSLLRSKRVPAGTADETDHLGRKAS